MPRILDVSGGVTWRRKRRGKVEKEKKKEKVAQIVVSSQARNGVAPLRWIDRKSLMSEVRHRWRHYIEMFPYFEERTG